MDNQMSMAVSMTALERLPVLPVSSVVLVPGMVLPLNVIHPAERELVDFIAQGRTPAFDLTPALVAERLPRMVALLLMSPDFQWR